jgi:hypothetical protein
MEDFPPDLSRLGRELTSAIDRSLRRKRFRRRLANRAATLGMSGALIFVAMTPAVLESATVADREETPGAGPVDPDRLAAALRVTQRQLGAAKEPRAATLRTAELLEHPTGGPVQPDGYAGPTLIPIDEAQRSEPGG